MTDTQSSPTTSSQVLIERLLNAPREQVFRAWTTPGLLEQWYAPAGCTIRFEHIDMREGGTYLSCLRTPDGKDCWCRGTYRQVLAPESLVFTMAVADADGNHADPAGQGMDPDWPAETVVTVQFDEEDGKTRLTLRQTVSEALAKRTGAHPGWLLMLDRLEQGLAQNKLV